MKRRLSLLFSVGCCLFVTVGCAGDTADQATRGPSGINAASAVTSSGTWTGGSLNLEFTGLKPGQTYALFVSPAGVQGPVAVSAYIDRPWKSLERGQLSPAVQSADSIEVRIAEVLGSGGFSPYMSQLRLEISPDEVNCSATSAAPTSAANRVGSPDSNGAVARTLTLNTNCGVIEFQLDPAAPETARSLTHLADGAFYNGSTCHRLTTDGIYVLQCGDPKGDGTGGPGYTIGEENLPEPSANGRAMYPRGTVAMANAGPGTTGSQFFLVYRDTELDPNYTVVGHITRGLGIVDYIAQGRVKGANPVDGPPTRKLQIESIRWQ